MQLSMFVLILSISLFGFVKTTFYPNFNWNPYNYLFTKKENCNDDHYQLNVRSGDYLSFVCPSQVLSNTELPSLQERHSLYENIYVVSKSEFDSCKIDKLTATTKLVLSCDAGLDTTKLKFKLFYIMSIVYGNKLTFKRGETYYFIATSNGTEAGLSSLKNGRCKTHNMKLALYVCKTSEECETKQCRNPILPSTQPPTTVSGVEETTAVKKVVVVPNVLPVVSERKQLDEDSSSDSKTLIVICLFCGIIAGILIGVTVVLLTQKVMRRKQKDGEVFTVEVQEDQNETLRREVNRKYFSEENASYRNSTEFKRLLSTSSGASSERYSASPLP